MHCRRFRLLHLPFIDGRLSATQTAAMWEHLDACDRCGRLDASVRRSLLLARNLPRVVVSAGFNARLSARLRETVMEPPRLLQARVAGALRYGATAAVIAAGFATMWAYRPPLMAAHPSDAGSKAKLVAHTAATSARPQNVTPRTLPEVHVSAQFAAGLVTGVAVWPGVLMADRTARQVATAETVPGTAP